MSQADDPVVPSSKEAARDAVPDTFMQKLCQQRLSGTSILFTAKWAIVLFAVLAVLFISFGIVLFDAAQSIVSFRQQYGASNQSAEDLSVMARAKWNELVDVLTVNVNERMEKPVWVQYELELFYQNHRRYRNSISWTQLSDPDSTSDSALSSDCSFWENDVSGRTWYPCGLVARSVFSDHFLVYKKESDSDEWTEVDVLEDRDSIIDESLGVEELFKNIEDKDSKGRNYWIFSQFPPETCLPLVTNVDEAEKDKAAIKALFVSYTDDDQPDCDYEDRTCKFSQSSNAKTSGADPVVRSCHEWKAWAEQAGLPYTYRSKQPKHYGVESSHFIVWFYLAGYHNFRKNWGKINDDIKNGTQLKIFVLDNFDVSSFGGKKYFSMTTNNWLGTNSTGLAIAYFSTGGCCLIATAYLVFVWTKRPRSAEAIRLDFVRQQ